MKVNKKRMTVSLVLTAGLTYTTVAPSITYANPSLSQINKETQQQQALKAQLSDRQQELQSELDKINKKQLKLTTNISDAQAEINKANDKIAALKDEIKIINKRIKERQGLLNDRLVSIYKNGGSINYLDVLFGSKNFGDFIDRTKALYTITQQDQKIINDQKNDQKAVSVKKKTVEKKQTSNVAKLEKLKSDLAEVEKLQDQRKLAVAALSNKQSDVSKKLAQLSGAASDVRHISELSYSPANHSSSHANTANTAEKNKSERSASGSSGKSNQSTPLTLSASVATGGISGILNYGNQFIGRSTYEFGASSPSTGQFDCSGFVHAAFAANGIGVGRSTSALVNTGRPVSYSQAKPGDLIFFDTYKTNGHVGIYLGGGRFIGSQSSTGVAVASVNNVYWKEHFSGVVRRVLN